MSTRIWLGDAAAIAQISTATPANVEIGDVFTLTINGKSVTFVATAATVANVTAGLVALWNASTIPEFTEITATDSTTHITLTADTAGVPFVVTGSATNVGGGTDDQTLTIATPTPATGPNHWSAAENWSGAAVPVDSDDVVIENSAVDILYGLAQSSVCLTSLTIRPTYTGNIGLPRTNAGGSYGGYVEYRDAYLAIGATSLTVDGGGGRIKVDCGTDQATVNVNSTGTPAETDVPALLWKGSHASNVVSVNKGSVGIAFFAGESAAVATLRIGYRDNVQSDSVVKAGAGCTLTTIVKSGGELEVNSNSTTITQTDGELIAAAGAVTTLNIYGGQVLYRSAGTITTLAIFGGEIDFRQDMRAVTVTNSTLYAGATLRDPNERVTFTNPVAIKTGLAGVTLELGTDFTIQRG